MEIKVKVDDCNLGGGEVAPKIQLLFEWLMHIRHFNSFHDFIL